LITQHTITVYRLQKIAVLNSSTHVRAQSPANLLLWQLLQQCSPTVHKLICIFNAPSSHALLRVPLTAWTKAAKQGLQLQHEKLYLLCFLIHSLFPGPAAHASTPDDAKAA